MCMTDVRAVSNLADVNIRNTLITNKILFYCYIAVYIVIRYLSLFFHNAEHVSVQKTPIV